MGEIFNRTCNKCKYNFSMSGSWEFYRDKDGNIKSYGHPGAMSEEAANSGIYGYRSDMFCGNCKKTFKDLIISEYKEPVIDRSKQKDADVKDEYKDGVKCPECGKLGLLSPWVEDKEFVCPKCGERELVSPSSWDNPTF